MLIKSILNKQKLVSTRMFSSVPVAYDFSEQPNLKELNLKNPEKKTNINL
jgi:hypothetical protein